MRARGRLLVSVLLLLLVALSVVYVIGVLKPPGEEPPLTLPFGEGSSFTLLRVQRLIVNGTEVDAWMSEQVIIVEKPGFPLTRARTLEGEVVEVPTVLLAVPPELWGGSFYAVISGSILGEPLCVHFRHDGWLRGGTPGACKSVLIEVHHDESGLTRAAVMYMAIGGALYYERVEVVARSIQGSSRVNREPVCDSFYSRSIEYAAPGLYLFDGRRVEYVAGVRYSEVKPLLIVLKHPANAELWRRLPETYRGYVLLVSPLLAHIDEVPELDRVLTEKVVRIN